MQEFSDEGVDFYFWRSDATRYTVESDYWDGCLHPDETMVTGKQLVLNDAVDWLGRWHPLAEQLGSADSLLALGCVSRWLALPPVSSAGSLKDFLLEYHNKILVPFDLPAIRAAFEHSCRNELRELVAFDIELSQERLLQTLSKASRRVGKAQLQKLRPLRDQRFVQRYLQAVEGDQANGWHTLVYGMTLWLYSLPLRQGLLAYAHQTTRGFIYSAAGFLRLSEHDCRALFNDTCTALPEAVESLIRESEAA